MTTVTAQEFDRDVSAAQRAAVHGPVIITDSGQPTFVLLTIEDYRTLTGAASDLVSWLSMEDDEIHLEPHYADLSLRIPTL